MKKGIVISGLIISLIIIGIGIYGFIINYSEQKNTTKISLEQIASKFNNSNSVKSYNENGMVLHATNTKNKLIISTTIENETSNLEYTLNENILSGNFTDDNTMTGIMISVIMADCIGQLHGYSDGELLNTLNSEQLKNYTLEQEGIKTEQINDNNFKIQIDINKKIPLADFSNVYFTVEDIEEMKDFIAGDGFAEKSKGNVWFYKSGYDNEYTLLMAEYNTLTNNTYNSIISILTVMFNNDLATEYFNNNYPNISTGNKQFEGFNITTNLTDLTDFEQKLLEPNYGYQFMKIVIDVNAVNSVINTQ